MSGLVPKLRFPEFQSCGEWPMQVPLGNEVDLHKGRGISKADIDPCGATRCIRYGELYTRYGEVISEVCSRTSVAADQLFLSHMNDVVIPASGETKEAIATAACVLLDGVALGADLNVLRTSHDGVFLSYLLNGPKRRAISKVAQGDSVVHLYPGQLAKVAASFPSFAEQRKIAECLTSLDELIAAEGRKLEALRAHKKGLMQNLFPREGETTPRLRFPEFRKAGEWEEKPLNELLYEAKRRNRDLQYAAEDVLSVSGEHGCVNQIELLGRSYAGASVKEYHVAETGDIVYTKSPLKRNPFGIIKANKGSPGIVSTLYAVYRTKEGCAPDFIDCYFSNDYRLNTYLQPIVRKGAKNDMKVNNLAVLGGNVCVPKFDEQRRIASCLASVDALIAEQTENLNALKTHKQGLMQGLFPSTEAS